MSCSSLSCSSQILVLYHHTLFIDINSFSSFSSFSWISFPRHRWSNQMANGGNRDCTDTAVPTFLINKMLLWHWSVSAVFLASADMHCSTCIVQFAELCQTCQRNAEKSALAQAVRLNREEKKIEDWRSKIKKEQASEKFSFVSFASLTFFVLSVCSRWQEQMSRFVCFAGQASFRLREKRSLASFVNLALPAPWA